jgi:hypothetical protein
MREGRDSDLWSKNLILILTTETRRHGVSSGTHRLGPL